MQKRTLLPVLTLCMVLMFLPGTADAADERPTSGNCGDNLTWEYNVTEMDQSGHVAAATLTIRGIGPMEKGDLHSSLSHYYCDALTVIIEDGVTSICEDAFSGNYSILYSIVSVSIPESVTSIGDNAFKHCASLTNIKIPDSVTSIGDGAFMECENLEKVELPSHLLSLGADAFSGCLKFSGDMVIPDGTLAISGDAFSGTALSSISIPASVIRIDSDWIPFMGTSNLETINVATGNSEYSSQDGVLYDKEKTVLIRCPAKKNTCIIPSTVKAIGKSAFQGCSDLVELIIPDSVEGIGMRAFDYCMNLKSIKIPDGVKYIDHRTFADCTSLVSVEIPAHR